MRPTLRIGTRGSKLALWRAHYTQRQLAAEGIDSELVVIQTTGDRVQKQGPEQPDEHLSFNKEIEEALRSEEIDVAVHAMKHLPTQNPEELVISAVSYRDNPADWLIVRMEALEEGPLFKLKSGAVVGTSSNCRKAQMLDYRRDVTLVDLRGSIASRLDHLRRGGVDAAIMGASGLSHLGVDLSDYHVVRFSPREFVPVPAQGVIAYQTRKDDVVARRLLKSIHHPDVSAVTNVERKVLQLLGDDRRLPLGVYCERDEQENYHVWAARADRWDAAVKRVRLSSSTNFGLAEQIAEALY